MPLLLDSVILIDHFNDIDLASHYIEENCDDVQLSVVTRAEILTGFKDSIDINNVRELLDLFPTVNLTKAEADLAAELRQKHRWKLPDAIQAAIALSNGLTFVTRNTKDFDPDRHEFVEIPYDLSGTKKPA